MYNFSVCFPDCLFNFKSFKRQKPCRCVFIYFDFIREKQHMCMNLFKLNNGFPWNVFVLALLELSVWPCNLHCKPAMSISARAHGLCLFYWLAADQSCTSLNRFSFFIGRPLTEVFYWSSLEFNSSGHQCELKRRL